MARRKTRTLTFMEKLVSKLQEVAPVHKQVKMIKNQYLVEKKDDILKAVSIGYTYAMIAEVATVELLERNVPKTFTVKNKEGEEVTIETKFTPTEIKKFVESV